MAYRNDILEDSNEKNRFNDEYGYELKVPETWEEYLDHAKFFTRDKGDTLMGETLAENFYGAVEWRLKLVTMEWFFIRFTSRIMDAAKTYFDPETMEPSWNNDIGVAVLEEMKEIDKYMPPIPPYSYSENLNAMNQGIVAQWISWPNCYKVPASDTTLSKVVGKMGVAPTPYL
jgi:multiple sugar transport system substrate-binding protein